MFGRRRFLSIGMLALVGTGACTDGEIFSFGVDEHWLPESHPAATEPAWSRVLPTWSGNGAELGYVLADARTAVSRSMSGGSRRILFTAPPPSEIVGLELSAYGSEWLTAASSGQPGVPGTTIRRHSATSTEVITDRGGTVIGTGPQGRVMLFGVNGDLAYIVRPDSLFLRRATTGVTRLLGVGCTAVAAVSPAGDGAICYPKPMRFTLDSLVGTPITASERYARMIDVVWNAQGTFLLSTYVGPYIFERLGESHSRFDTPNGQHNEHSGSGFAAIARDGRSFAYANGYCARMVPIALCEAHQTIIYRADAQTRRVERVAVHSGPSGIPVSISAATRRIAYVVDGQLYILSGS